MHNYILHSGDSIVFENASDMHGYKIYMQSPLGKAMNKAERRGKGTYVLLSDLPNFNPMLGPFSKLRGSLGLEQVLNVGKEWIFRSLFSLGDECTGEDSLNTNQSFQTRLKWTGDSFRICTQVSGCKDGQHKCYMVEHEFCFKVHTGGEYDNEGKRMYKRQAQEKFVDEILSGKDSEKWTRWFGEPDGKTYKSNNIQPMTSSNGYNFT